MGTLSAIGVGISEPKFITPDPIISLKTACFYVAIGLLGAIGALFVKLIIYYISKKTKILPKDFS